jgi:glutamyl-tRNA synthetase
MTTVRTRFAPSPTGFLHVGNVRAALFPWLVARQNGGQFILRVEDTDRAREVEGAVEIMHETLGWLGLDWDEGPDIGGPYAPYTQTERKDSYLKWAQKLIDKGLAYADPYTPEEVQAFRDKAVSEKKPFLYRSHRPENPPEWDGSQPLRFKIPELKTYKWHDAIMGDLSAGPEALDDFIIIKSDGLPTYNFAHIVDDAEMQITHVIRGLEYISSVPKFLALYEGLGIEPPVLAHMPHIMTPDGKKKLGKRDGAKSILDYKAQGFLPEAMLNFLASMGWNDGTEQEIFTRDELIKKFSLDRVQRAGAKFDEQRLHWMNGHWIRQLTTEELAERVKDFWPESAKDSQEAYKRDVLSLVQERLKFFAELPQLTEFFFTEPTVNLVEISAQNKQFKKLGTDEQKHMLSAALETLKQSDFSEEDLEQKLRDLVDKLETKPGILFSLIRAAITGSNIAPGLFETLHVLGKETSLARIEAAKAE